MIYEIKFPLLLLSYNLKKHYTMRTLKLLLPVLCALFMLSSHKTYEAAGTAGEASIEKRFKYIVIPDKALTFNLKGKDVIVHKILNPSETLTEIFKKEGYTVLPELIPELESKTLIVNCGTYILNEGKSYTLGVNIQLISAETSEMIDIRTAKVENTSETEAFNKAIEQELTKLLSE